MDSKGQVTWVSTLLRTALVSLISVLALVPSFSWIGAAADVLPGHIGKIRWAYYVAYAPASYQSVWQNMGNLDYLSPYWYHMDGEGNLIYGGDSSLRDKNRDAVISLARKHGVKILPMVKNSATYDDFHSVLADQPVRDKAIKNLVDMVNSGKFDGVHVDFEAVNAEDRDGLTAFMAGLSAAMRPQGKLVTQAVAAKDTERMTGWAGPYDYAALAQHNDLIVLMTYAYGIGKPQSTAPFPWVERSVVYASSQIPPYKLLLGLAWYGYDWNLTTGGTPKALDYSDVFELLRKHNLSAEYDPDVKSPHFRYVEGGQEHEVWYEDKRSNDDRLDLAQKHGLAGAAGWRIGHEEQLIWKSLSDRLGYRTWLLAEGATTEPFHTWILIMNPNGYAVNARVTFMKENGETVVRQYKLAPTSRLNVFANNEAPNSAFSTKVEADGPIFVERAMYFGQDGHASTGINAPSRNWYLPDGDSKGTHTWLLLMNPNNMEARVKVTFIRGSGPAVEKEFRLAPTSRLNVFANNFVPDTNFSIMAEGDVPVVAEKATYIEGSYGGTGSPGASYLSRRWYLAEGFTGHNVRIALMNPNPADVKVKVTFMREGEPPIVREVSMGPVSRQGVQVNNIIPADTAFSTQIESSHPIAVERTSTWSNGGFGHSSLAMSSPSRTWYLPEGSTAPPFLDYVLIMNPNAQSSRAVVTFMTEAGKAITKELLLGAKSRSTIFVNAEVPNAAVSVRVESELPVMVERAMYFGAGGSGSHGVGQ